MVTVLILTIGVSSCGGEESTAPRETIDGIEVDLSLLPEELQPLVPLIREYAGGDDVERTDRLYAASTDELRNLDRTMSAERFEAVEAFLDAHLEESGTPAQDVALVSSSFAEAAAEAGVVLEEREATVKRRTERLGG